MVPEAGGLHAATYILPFAPLCVRLLMALKNRKHLTEVMRPEEQDRDAHRALILAMAGFSFTGLIGLIVVEGSVGLDLRPPIFALLVSFVAYMASLNMQSYKFFLWLDYIADGLRDTANFSLVLAVVFAACVSSLDHQFVTVISCIAIVVWLIDFLVRLALEQGWLASKGPHK